jgi:hypothetical protein
MTIQPSARAWFGHEVMADIAKHIHPTRHARRAGRRIRLARLSRLGRLIAAAAVGAGAVLAFAAPASASFTTNTIGCAGSATISGTGSDSGKSVTINATDAKVTMLRQGVVNWHGSVTTPTHNNSGKVVIDLGYVKVTAGSWGPSTNASSKTSRSGVAHIPSALRYVPPGTYHMTGYHKGDEGECVGAMDVVFTGSILSTPVGIAAIIGTILSAFGVLFAGLARVVL